MKYVVVIIHMNMGISTGSAFSLNDKGCKDWILCFIEMEDDIEVDLDLMFRTMKNPGNDREQVGGHHLRLASPYGEEWAKYDRGWTEFVIRYPMDFV